MLGTDLISHKVFETADSCHDGNGAVSRCRLRYESTGLKAAGDDHVVCRHHQQVRCPLVKFGNACTHHNCWRAQLILEELMGFSPYVVKNSLRC